MRRDYKNVRRPRDRRRGGPPGWLWAAAGLSLGLLVAYLVYLRHEPARAPSAAAPPPARVPAARPSEPARATAPPPAPAEPKPRFEFYTILPGMAVPARPDEAANARPDPSRSGQAGSGAYLLQVGSFRTFEEADRLKAALSLQGLEVSIQSVAREGKSTVHRVRVGPFSDMAKVNEARRRLKEQSLDSIVLKAKT